MVRVSALKTIFDVSVFVIMFLVAVILAPIPVVKAGTTVPSINSVSIEWITNEPNFKKAILHMDSSEGTYSFLFEGVVEEAGIEHNVVVDGFLLLSNGTEVFVGSAGAAVNDTLYGAPYAPSVDTPVDTLKIHLPTWLAELIAFVSLIIIVSFFVYAIAYILEATVLQALLDTLQWVILVASIPWVYLTLYLDRNPDASLTLFIPLDEYILPTLEQGMLYVATPYSWWLLQKQGWWIFSWYSAIWACPTYQMPPNPPQLPSASFVWTPDVIFPGEEVIFHSTSYDPDGEIQNCHWYFGDWGRHMGKPSITHTRELVILT